MRSGIFWSSDTFRRAASLYMKNGFFVKKKSYGGLCCSELSPPAFQEFFTVCVLCYTTLYWMLLDGSLSITIFNKEL